MTRSSTTLTVGLLLLLAAYTLPWTVNGGQGMTLNAYDLAEWASLHPAVRADPLLLTALLLRLPLLCITWLVALYSTPRTRLIRAAGCVLLAISQLPPLEFITQSQDPNYRQQFILSSISLGGALVVWAISRWRDQSQQWLSALVILVCLGSSLAGCQRALVLLSGLGLPAGLGAGVVAWVLVCTGVLLFIMGDSLTKRRTN